MATAAGRVERVLIIDDNRPLAQAVALALELGGWQTRLGHDGVAALEIAAQFRPHAALIDLRLPLLDGFEVASRLRTEPIYGSPRLIAWTGTCDERGRCAALAAGFETYLVKPVCFDEIRSVLAARRPRRTSATVDPR